MDRLVSSGLSGSGLIPIRSPLLVDRYNECLKAIGVEPTRLTAFDIDGKGWSPQIASEKNNPFYLSHGGAVQFAIILSPNQQGKPVYRPFYSFERSVLDRVFSNHAKSVADLTSRAGIWLEIGPGVVRFDNPQDLLLVESVTVTLTDTAGTMVVAAKQKELVERFRTRPRAWSDPGLRQAIIESAKVNGDLRYREVIIPQIKVTDLEFFYAEVFGGTFVLFHEGMKSRMLVVADERQQIEQGLKRAYSIGDDTLAKRLFDEGIVEIPVDWYREHPEALQELWDSLLVEALYSDGKNEVDFNRLTPAQKKKLALDLMTKLPKEFSDLERFLSKLDCGDDAAPRVSRKLRMLLMRPHRSLSKSAAKVVWRLITRMTPVSLADLYEYDKPTFFARYPHWPESRRMWAVEHLTTRASPSKEND